MGRQLLLLIELEDLRLGSTLTLGLGLGRSLDSTEGSRVRSNRLLVQVTSHLTTPWSAP